MDGEALTSEDVCTFCFLATSFLVVAFFAWDESQDDFLMEIGGYGRDYEEDVNHLFFVSFQYEFKLSSISFRQAFAWNFRIFTVESRQTQPIQ